jgi:hypothetical protein
MFARLTFASAVIAFASLAACARQTSPFATSPSTGTALDPAQPTSPATLLKVSSRCFGPFRAGTYQSLACVVLVEEGGNPQSTDLKAFADLSMFGRGDQVQLGRCPACGFPPRTFDLDLHVPADTTPGMKVFTVWATDAEGRRTEAAASFEVIAR